MSLPNQTEILLNSRVMTDTKPEKEIDLNTDTQEVMDDLEDKNEKNDMFVSAMDSPSDSGLETNKPSQSDPMDDLSLQVKIFA